MNDSSSDTRAPFDLEGLARRSASVSCFVCEFLSGNPEFAHDEIGRTSNAVIFLDKFPTLFGRVLVAPRTHLENVTGDFTMAEYLELQQLVYLVAEGLRALLEPERVYLLSLGSQAANAHVHWHLAPLPVGVPLPEQQFHSLMHEFGAIETQTERQQWLAQELRGFLVKNGINFDESG